MDPHEPFLKAILADRQNDLPRLVYADWLEESGEPHNVARAHFIRTQIHLETTPPRTELHRELKDLEARILDWYLDDWRYELPEFVRFGTDVDRVVWRRGFADDLGPMDVDTFARSGAAALAEHPLTSVHLTGRTSAIRFEDHPTLAHVGRLKLGPAFHPLTPDPPDADEATVTFASLMSAPVFTSLRHLDLSENAISDSWLVRFAAAFPHASFAPTLESLDLSTNYHITNAGANALATSPAFDRLIRLRIRDTGMTASGTTMLKKRFGDRLG
jgi:uncharacterized protein (TIGR02996 family)